jgi:hypothetical protein
MGEVTTPPASRRYRRIGVRQAMSQACPEEKNICAEVGILGSPPPLGRLLGNLSWPQPDSETWRPRRQLYTVLGSRRDCSTTL